MHFGVEGVAEPSPIPSDLHIALGGRAADLYKVDMSEAWDSRMVTVLVTDIVDPADGDRR